jgi:isoleucyl-tRNA synthetase
LTMTPELLQEWVAREISRFLNQMRKDAGYNVDDKVNLRYTTNSQRLEDVLNKFWEFLKDEALIATLSAQVAWEEPLSNAYTQVFTSENEDIIFTINR